jgi:hypothetical protein
MPTRMDILSSVPPSPGNKRYYRSAAAAPLSGSVLAGLLEDRLGGIKPAATPEQAAALSPPPKRDGFIRSKKDDETLRSGGVPSGWRRDEQGRPRPLVQ